MKKIIKNSVQCTKCNDIIVSEVNGLKVTCRCGNVTIDGGTDVLIRESTGSQYIDKTKYLLID